MIEHFNILKYYRLNLSQVKPIMRTFFWLLCLIIPSLLNAQDINKKIDDALNSLKADPLFRHATISFCLADAHTNKNIYGYNELLGLAPASVQKVVTSTTTYDILGGSYKFRTKIGYSGSLRNGMIDGNLVIKASGDPSLGSWRWGNTSRSAVLNKVSSMLKQAGIKSIRGKIIIDDGSVFHNPVPNGWTWEDMGNYYGAGSWGLNWHENQYNIHFSSSSVINSDTKIIYTNPFDLTKHLRNHVRSGPSGSGDNAIVFTAAFSNDIFVTGTIPVNEKNFRIKGALPDPRRQFIADLDSVLKNASVMVMNEDIQINLKSSEMGYIESPLFDSLNYWFLKESINLYGEAFLNKIGSIDNSISSREEGLKLFKEHWEKIGISSAELGILDGSGLSPANRITTNSIARILLYARNRPWFNSFQKALPVMNGISMKDGYISGVRSYAGYINSKGKQYSFAFIVNNFTGSASLARTRMYKILDILK